MHIQRTAGFCWSRRAQAGSVLNTGKHVQAESRLFTQERLRGARKSISARHSGDRNSHGSSHMVQVYIYWWTSDWGQSRRGRERLNPQLFVQELSKVLIRLPFPQVQPTFLFNYLRHLSRLNLDLKTETDTRMHLLNDQRRLRTPGCQPAP